MADFTNQSLKFHSDVLGDNTLLIHRLVGEEQLSGMFRFSLDLISIDKNIDLEKVLYQPAKIGIEQRLPGGMKTFRWFHGTLESIHQAEQGQDWTTYRAVLVPDMWKLSEFYRSRIVQHKTVDELVAHVLKQDLKLQSGTDFEFKLTRTDDGDPKERAVYPEREYVVQYEEDDLTFVKRWLEHEGIFFFFENDGTAEKVVFADSVSAYAPVNKGRSSAFPYRPQGRSQSTGGSQGQEAPPEEILGFQLTVTRRPNSIALNDYNWRDPSVPLGTSTKIECDGVGKQTEYNDHFKTPEQGAALSHVRAEEWNCRSSLYSGTSTSRSFRPGRTFDLEEHFRDDFNRSYMLVSVVHEADQAINLEASTVTGASYKNTFQAIASDLDFRPERLTNWPSIKGTMNARVDGEGDGELAEIDEHGRYKLRFPFDEEATQAAAGKASRWVRMAQPYAGANSGFHFPLLKGTEVLVTHIDGDPDRPIIAAAVPNPESVSPVSSGNATQNRVQTTSGNLFLMDDDEDSNGFVMIDGGGRQVQDFRLPLREGAASVGAGPGYGGERPPHSAPTAPAPARPTGTPATSASGPPAPPPALHLHGLHPAGGPLPQSVVDRWRSQQQLGPGSGVEVFGALTFSGSTDSAKVDQSTTPGNFGVVDGYDDDGDGVVDAGATAASGAAVYGRARTPLEYFVEETAHEALTNQALEWMGTYGDHAPSGSTGKTLPAGRSYILAATEWDPAVRLLYLIGDQVTIKDGGTNWTLDNVSNSINFGTGGYGFSQDGTAAATADNTSVSYHFGNDTSFSEHTGNSNSTSVHTGADTSNSTHTGDSNSTSVHTGEETSNSTHTGGSNSTSVHTGNSTSNSTHTGDSNDTSVQTGNATSHSTLTGNSTSTSIHNGTASSYDTKTGGATGTSHTLGSASSTSFYASANADASIHLSANTSAKLEIGVSATASLTLGASVDFALKAAAWASLSIWAGMSAELEIYAALKAALTISATMSAEMNISAQGGVEMNLSADGRKVVDIPAKTEISIKGDEVHITKGDVQIVRSISSVITKI